MPDYSIVKLINQSKPQTNGNTVVALPGGKAAIDVQQADASNQHAIPPTGQSIATANSLWGLTPGQIASYPTFYEGSNTATPTTATPTS